MIINGTLEVLIMTKFRELNFKGARVENCINAIEELIEDNNKQLGELRRLVKDKSSLNKVEEYYQGKISMAHTVVSLIKAEFEYEIRTKLNTGLPSRVDVLRVLSIKHIQNELDEYEIEFEIKEFEGLPLLITYFSEHREWSKVELPPEIVNLLRKSQLRIFEYKLNSIDLHKQLWNRLSTDTEHKLKSLFMNIEKTKESS